MATTSATVSALACASAAFSATAASGTTCSGTAGVTGLTAALQAGTLARGAGSLAFGPSIWIEYSMQHGIVIQGTPHSVGPTEPAITAATNVSWLPAREAPFF